jgi:hypothetical protein
MMLSNLFPFVVNHQQEMRAAAERHRHVRLTRTGSDRRTSRARRGIAGASEARA